MGCSMNSCSGMTRLLLYASSGGRSAFLPASSSPVATSVDAFDLASLAGVPSLDVPLACSWAGPSSGVVVFLALSAAI